MIIIGLFFFLLSLGVSQMLKSKFRKYAQTPLRSNMSGAEAAQRMLADNGITDVTILSVEGQLTDHYNPGNKTVNLSHDVYHGRNAAAVAVAAHECGHAVQHAKAYSFLTFRSAMVPLLSATSQYMHWIILIGVLLINTTPIPLGIGILLFGATTLFSFVTLPVEFDASKRALAWIETSGAVSSQEHTMAKDALWWAAMTYVVAALGSLAQLLYLVMMFLGSRD
ncbi:zinc metallopeptidase [Cytophagales bacterium LB-30]|uniref:Zinc metallopeptidase n=1 Tax=Shiella aurantiaca TaxID=3058365 RepID=A0ABT8F5Z3_9BACT|nr:zinc metallopeptidase [Shiella aurantiaca]MDN4165723.1 zinc metallopeptidase [Shiella aurantiaca]